MPSTYIIAEAGVNHNGSISLAKELIDAAKEAGADAVKFQTYCTEELVCEKASKADYQLKTTDASESQFDMLKKLELDEEAHHLLIEYARSQSIDFISTPFDEPSVDLLVHTFDLPLLKIPSGEITNAPLLLKIARTKKPVILSTGMSTLGEVEKALAVLAFGYVNDTASPSREAFMSTYATEEGQQALQEKVTLLHCTSEYPTPFSEVNLRVMDTLKQAFSLPVGLSDHTQGISIPIAAVARGAKVIEKHFTVDRHLPGPDHKASLEPNELRAMVRGIREVEQALGSQLKAATTSEQKNIMMARKSIVAKTDIRQGEVFSEKNVAVKRPGEGLSPFFYWDLMGKKAQKNFKKDDIIQ